LWVDICVGNSRLNTMKSPICRPTLLKPQITFSLFYLRFHFYRYESSDSGRKMWKLKWHEFKLDHITCSDAFIFHSYSFQFMSSVTVKWYTFHLYITYLCYSYNICFLLDSQGRSILQFLKCECLSHFSSK
jgi:hypothetical protein